MECRGGLRPPTCFAPLLPQPGVLVGDVGARAEDARPPYLGERPGALESLELVRRHGLGEHDAAALVVSWDAWVHADAAAAKDAGPRAAGRDAIAGPGLSQQSFLVVGAVHLKVLGCHRGLFADGSEGRFEEARQLRERRRVGGLV